MKKTITNFVCQECGYDTPQWYGKCPECGMWNTLKEMRFSREKGTTTAIKSSSQVSLKPQKLQDIVYQEKSRIRTEYEELNTVLGGGIVRGSVSLIAGDPGVGKSTLLLQLALSLSSGRDPKKVLYISGEESVEQVKMRAERIAHSLPVIARNEERMTNRLRRVSPLAEQSPSGSVPSRGLPRNPSVDGSLAMTKSLQNDNLFLLALTDADLIVEQMEEMKPDLVVIDSIQTIESQNVQGLSGSVGQVRYGALQFVRSAKQNNIPVIIVGHVTKEGMVAGPMVLSHMVDTVLFLEGEKFAKTRILRSLKNRFGPVDEVGIFVMEEEGMQEASNPEQLFLTRSANAGPDGVPGSVLVATLEGSRAFLVELQALAVTTRLPMPRRVVSGVDSRRVELLLAVLQKHCRLPVDTMDVFVNVAGGMKLSDPGIDLSICLAVYSSVKNVPMQQTVGIAEVGLLGELRDVTGSEKRVKEAEKMGYKNIITAKKYKTLSQVLHDFGGGKS